MGNDITEQLVDYQLHFSAYPVRDGVCFDELPAFFVRHLDVRHPILDGDSHGARRIICGVPKILESHQRNVIQLLSGTLKFSHRVDRHANYGLGGVDSI